MCHRKEEREKNDQCPLMYAVSGKMKERCFRTDMWFPVFRRGSSRYWPNVNQRFARADAGCFHE